MWSDSIVFLNPFICDIANLLKRGKQISLISRQGDCKGDLLVVLCGFIGNIIIHSNNIEDKYMTNKQAHLEMIQGIVNRLSQNSFLLKGWTVVLISALIALAAKDTKLLYVYLAYFPSIAFWGLDGYFLYQERLFRKLYDRVRNLSDDEIDFSMNTSVIKDDVSPWLCVTFSITLIVFHGVILSSIILIMLLSNLI